MKIEATRKTYLISCKPFRFRTLHIELIKDGEVVASVNRAIEKDELKAQGGAEKYCRDQITQEICDLFGVSEATALGIVNRCSFSLVSHGACMRRAAAVAILIVSCLVTYGLTVSGNEDQGAAQGKKGVCIVEGFRRDLCFSDMEMSRRFHLARKHRIREAIPVACLYAVKEYHLDGSSRAVIEAAQEFLSSWDRVEILTALHEFEIEGRQADYLQQLLTERGKK